MNNKTIYVLHKRPQFIFVTVDLKIVEADFYRPSSFWKRDILNSMYLGLFISGPLIRTFLWKCRPLLCRSVTSILCIYSTATQKSDIVSRLIVYRNNFYYMDPSQSDSLMKPPISWEHDSLRCNICVLIDSATTLRFASYLSLNQNGLVGKCIRGPKIVVHNAFE